jgi:hypothetical protein
MSPACRLIALTAPLALAVTSLVGCSSDPAPGPDPAPAPSTSRTEAISPPKLTAVPDLRKPTGIVKDTTMGECTRAQGPVEAKGTVKNSGTRPQDLVVVVSWILPQGSDVVARGVAVVKNAPAGSEHDWTVSSKVAVDQETQCVLSSRRGALRG